MVKKDNVILQNIQYKKFSIKISYSNSSERNEKSINIENSGKIKLDAEHIRRLSGWLQEVFL